MRSDPFSVTVFIGGPAASGKTTVARLLARKRGLRCYSTDAHGWSHRDRAIARGLHDPNDPSPGDFDRGPFIEEDLDHLRAAAPAAGTVVEGALITPDIAPITRAVWLMPTPGEQRQRLTQRSAGTTIHHGLLYGHRLINQQLAGTRAAIIDVTGQTVTETLDTVEATLAAALEGLPAGHMIADRQRLIRYANQSLADQLRVYLANGQIDASGRESQRTFDCECGRADCTGMVQLRPVDAIQLCDQPPGAIQVQSHLG